MSTNKKFLTACIVCITLLGSILTISSPAQAEQSFTKVRADAKNAVAQVDRDYYRYPNRYPERRRLARLWERMRWERYDRCLRYAHYRGRCRYILEERNPYRWYD